MTLTAGSRLGPYEILTLIGAGGMGEVYKARDTRLDRTVAIKVLPSRLSLSQEARLRFDREAKAVSSLNHPHICTLHDVGQQEGVEFLVMEYLEGETLAARLEKGPLALDQVLRTAIEIASALDKAHRQGLIHRDLKPANVMLTKSGAKLLDFGLAKLQGLEAGSSTAGVSALTTEGRNLTAEGTILGTFAYMAPEQLEGKEADARTDLFALGVLIYEMATGKRAFQGKSQASLISAIMSFDPQPISALQPMTPPALDRVVKVCIAKDPDERWQTSHDVMLQLTFIAEGGPQAASSASVAARRGRENLGWIVAGVLLLAGLAAIALYPRQSTPDARVIRLSVSPPEGSTVESISVSPDGRRLAFVAMGPDGRTLLWLRPLDSYAAQPLVGTEGAAWPFWSPDNRSLGFFAQGKLKRIDAAGSLLQTLCDASDDPRGGTWNQDGIILFSPNFGSPLHQVSAGGGTSTPVTALDASQAETSHRWPSFLPDGRHFIYLVRSAQPDHRGIYVASLNSKDARRLVSVESSAAYAAPGYLLFVRERILMAQPFDATKFQISGDSFPVAEGVGSFGESGPTGYAPFSASGTGVLAHGSVAARMTQLVWFDRTGQPLGPIGPPGTYTEPALSPDGQRVALGRDDPKTGRSDLWVLDLSRGVLSRFTFHPSNDYWAVWSPDGSRIVWASDRAGHDDLYLKPSSGASQDELLLESDHVKWPDDWSRDGRFIVYEESNPTNPKTLVDLWVLPLSADRKPFPFLRTEFNETHAQLSPDSRWMAYVSDESGRAEVYVQTFPRAGGKRQVSTDGGDQPQWRRDGRELFYLAPEGKLMAAEVKGGPTFEAAVPVPLFGVRVPAVSIGSFRNHFVVSPDGQRFLVNTIAEGASSSPITVVLNWTVGSKK
ncbi:MAG: hypothetical protein DMH00_10485 [Acidobacteria bacterium]|nr:MAG: hypothetical protein DMH00_10485 [Acidobacteriota bacterium]